MAAVCHGPAGLLEARTRNGEYLIKGRKVTGFSWTEEEKAGRDSAVPFSLAGELQARGAAYEKAWMAGSTHVVEDGLLVTGQNSASARAVGEAVVKRFAGA